MSKIAVVYKSKYGSTKTYAEWIAEALDADLIADKRDLSQYDAIIYGGGIYAGSINGLSAFAKDWGKIKDKRVIIFTVSASDPTDAKNADTIRSHVYKALPTEMREQVKLFFFRGGLFYSKMSFIHKMMMSLLIKTVKGKPEQQRTQDEIEMLATVGKDTDTSDKSTISALVAEVKSSKA